MLFQSAPIGSTGLHMSSDSSGSGIFLNIACGITRVSWRGWTMCCKTLFEPGWLPIGSIGHSHGYPPSKLGSGAIAPWCSTSRKTMGGPPRRRGPIVQARMRRFFTRAASPAQVGRRRRAIPCFFNLCYFLFAERRCVQQPEETRCCCAAAAGRHRKTVPSLAPFRGARR